MRIAILGFSQEGKSTFAYLKPRLGAQDEIWILDANASLKVPRGVHSQLGDRYLEGLERFDVIYRTPGMPYNHPALVAARARDARFLSATKLFFKHCPAPIIGVTGTKGKGTTATLIYKILKAAGRDAYLVGNIGVAALEIIPKLNPHSIVVFELSSFQLQDLEQSPHIAVVLDMFPDHLDDIRTARHGTHLSFKEYVDSKANICRHQTRRDAVFYLAHNPITRRIARQGKGKKIPVTEKGFGLFPPSLLKIPGMHNYRNAIVAAQVSRYLKIPDAIIRRAAGRYRGLPHRLELVRTIIKAGARIEIYNDSQSTGPQPTAAAIRAFSESDNVLIAGGYDKGLDYRPLAQALGESTVGLLILMGANRRKILAALPRQRAYKVIETHSLKAALKAAYRFARSPQRRRPVRRIILSPAAASFDMFKNYIDRGNQFRQLAKDL